MDQQTRLQLPKDGRRQQLYLVQPYLLLQCKILDKTSFTLEIGFTDENKNKRRLHFFAAQHYCYSRDNIAQSAQAARIPTGLLLENVWLNLQFDLVSFIDQCFSEKIKLRSVDAVTLTGNCLIRKIATCKQPIPDSF